MIVMPVIAHCGHRLPTIVSVNCVVSGVVEPSLGRVQAGNLGNAAEITMIYDRS